MMNVTELPLRLGNAIPVIFYVSGLAEVNPGIGIMAGS